MHAVSNTSLPVDARRVDFNVQVTQLPHRKSKPTDPSHTFKTSTEPSTRICPTACRHHPPHQFRLFSCVGSGTGDWSGKQLQRSRSLQASFRPVHTACVMRCVLVQPHLIQRVSRIASSSGQLHTACLTRCVPCSSLFHAECIKRTCTICASQRPFSCASTQRVTHSMPNGTQHSGRNHIRYPTPEEVTIRTPGSHWMRRAFPLCHRVLSHGDNLCGSQCNLHT